MADNLHCCMRCCAVAALLLLAGAPLGCEDDSPRLDGSSDAAFQASMTSITQHMTEDEQREFLAAVAMVGVGEFEGAADLAITNPAAFQERTRKNLDGKSVSEILEEAKKKREELGVQGP